MRRRRAGQACIALGLAFGWASLGRVGEVAGLPYAPGPLAALPMNAAVEGAATALFVLALGAFGLGRGREAAGGGLALLLALGTQAMAWQWPGEVGANSATMLPGGALAAWWVARRVGRRAGEDEAAREARGVEAACGVVAAGYFVAAASKVYTSGLAWAGPANIGLQIATQGSLVPEPLQGWRLAAAASRWLCGTVGVGTLILEGGALSFLWPAARLPHALLLVAMHLGIAVLMGLHHYDWMFTALGWALVSTAPRPPAPG